MNKKKISYPAIKRWVEKKAQNGAVPESLSVAVASYEAAKSELKEFVALVSEKQAARVAAREILDSAYRQARAAARKATAEAEKAAKKEKKAGKGKK